MRSKVSVLIAVGALFALQGTAPVAAGAAEEGQHAGQQGESRWVPSLAITSGALIQRQDGFVSSVFFEGMSTTPVPVRPVVTGDDLIASPFVGAELELMTPALPVPTRPRFFLGAEILPTFGSDRDVAIEGDPGCIRGPQVGAPCVTEIVEPPEQSFQEGSAQGEGSSLTTLIDTLTFGANMGVAFPAQLAGRQLRIKPSFGWIHFKLDADGLVKDAECLVTNFPVVGSTQCTDSSPPPRHGFLREITLMGDGSQTFNGIGPGLDIEMDVGRYFDWLGVSLFLGGRAYRVIGDRTITFSDSESYDDELGTGTSVADWEMEVDPWMYRAHVGIRFHFLGFPE